MKNLHPKNTNKGYTLLFAVLTATLVLGVAVFILSVSKRQFMLSATARDSMVALYAADAGLECIVADVDNRYSTSSHEIYCNSANGSPTTNIINVEFQGDQNYTDSAGSPHTDGYATLLNLGFKNDDVGDEIYGCALVYILIYDTGSTIKTTIESRGYNICKLDDNSRYVPDIANSRIVERARKLSYE